MNRRRIRTQPSQAAAAGTRRWFCRLEWKVQDLWVGVFWKRAAMSLDVWVCVVPCVPIHFGWNRTTPDR